MSAKTERFCTRFINDESQVPDGYVPLAKYQPGTRLHRAMVDAHRTGKVRAVKLVRHEGDLTTGHVWVHEGDACDFAQAYGQAKKPVRCNQPASAVDDKYWAILQTCVEILDTVKGIAESMPSKRHEVHS